MKEKAEELRDELSRIILEQSQANPNAPTVFPPELIQRVVAYVLQQRGKGITSRQCSQRLNISHARLHYWMYARSKTAGKPPKCPPSALRPVQVSAEMVPVYDGVRERRYAVRSPAGWEVKDLTLQELTEILRGLI
jgi:hypothetical protein